MQKILIVEDDPTFRTFLEKGLPKHLSDVEILTASDGQIAIDILQRETIALMVTDLKLPKVNGIHLLLFARENHPGLPCIAMTAHNIPNLRERLPNDILYFLSKPFKISRLAELIDKEFAAKSHGLRGISVPGFAQLLEMERITGFLEVEDVITGNKGSIAFKDGTPYNAFYKDLDGEEAAIRLLAMENVAISLNKETSTNTETKIESGMLNLILEAMRRKDEGMPEGS